MRKELLVLLTMLLLPYTAQGDAVSDPISYGLKIGETELTSDNVTADGNITGLTGVTGTVKFMPANAETPATLILDNATIGTSEGPTYIMSNYANGQLTISLAGTNKLYGIIFDDSGEGTLAFTGNGSFNISCSDGPIGGYTDVDFGDFNLISSLPGIHYDNDDHRLVDYQSVGVREVTLTKTAVYPLWLGGVQVTDDNKGGITGGEISGTVTFNPTGNILTLTGASLGSPSSDYEAPIISDLQNLEININGECRIQGRQNVVIDDARGGIMSLDTDATLVLSTNYTTSSEANSPTMRIDSNPIASGFKSISTDHQMIYKRTSDYYWVQRIAEPTISLVYGRLQISDNNEIDLADAANSAVTLKYKITDASGTTGEEKTFNSETNEPIENPCKIDAWAVYQDQESDHSTGVYFGIADKTIVFNSTTSGSELKGSDLELLPATEDVEPTIIGTDAAEVVAFDAETGKATIAGVGTCNVMVKLSVSGGSNIQFLNPVNGEVVMLPCKVTVVPDEEEQQAKMTVSAVGFEGTYDGKAHSITVTVTTPAEGAVVKYGITEGSYDLTENPTYTDAGTYTVYYQVTKDGYEATTGSAKVIISKATPTVTAPTAKENLTYTGGAQELINAGSTSGGEMQYSLDNATFSTSIPTGTEAQEYTVYYKVVGGTNYEDVAAASIKVTISDAKMTVSAKGFEGTYDGKAHSITVTVTTPAEGAVVKYGTTEGSYDLDASPTYTDAGRYIVYYQVTKTGYLSVTGSEVISITPGTGSISFAEASVSKTVGDEPFTNALTNTGDAAVTYESSETNVATVDANGQVSIVGAGETTITATVGDGINYIYEDKTATFTLTVEAQEEPEPQPEPVEPTLGWVDANQNPVDAVTVIFGDDYSALPTLLKTEGLEVTYNSSETSVAKVDENGAVKIITAGTTTIKAAFAGSDTYKASEASYVLTVSKAKTELKFSAATATATMNAEFQAPILTKSPENLEGVKFTSSNTAVATVDKNTGAVTLVGAGETTIKATFAGSTVYEAAEASYALTVNRAAGEGYLLWVNDTQVTSDNAEDVLGHKTDSSKPYYIYNKDKKQLYMDNDQTRTTVIESRMPELTVYIKDANKIKRIFFNNTGDTSNKGNLTFTTNGNFPGKLIIANPTKGQSAIKGFSNISYNWDLTAIEPDGSYYDTTTLEMKYKNEMEATVIADTITIGEAIVPITEKRAITFEESQLVEKDEDGKVKKDESGNPIKANLSNYSYAPSSTTGEPEKNVIHISLNSANISDDAGGFDIENGVGGIYIEDTMTDEKAGQVAQDVNDNKIVPGGTLYAESYDGFTFKLIAGSGTIVIDEIVENDHEFHLIIGINKPITLNYNNSIIWPYDGKSVRVQAEIAFNVGAPTYCFLYMVKKTAGARTRMGKRERAYGKLVSIQVMATTVIPTDPPSEATGGILDEDDDPEVEIVSGIREVKSGDMKSEKFNNRWYTLDGRPLQSKPTKAGIYLFNQKKVLFRGNE